MKIYSITFLFLILSFFNSCENQTKPTHNLMPSELQESSFSLSSKGRNNMVDHIYFNVVDTNANLAQLHKKIDLVEEKYRKWLVTFNDYQTYAEKYAEDANRMIQNQQFSDTLIKKSALEMLANFEAKHKKRSAQLMLSKHKLDALNLLLKDKIIVLKLVVSLPIINKYLDRNLPKNVGTQEIINEYESLLKQVEKEISAQ